MNYFLCVFFHLVDIRQTNDNNDDAKQNVIYLSHIVYLPNVTQIEFRSMSDVSHWKHIQLILQYVYIIFVDN